MQHKMLRRKALYSALMLALPLSHAYAEEAPAEGSPVAETAPVVAVAQESGDFEMPTVVVSAAGYEQDIKNAPASISVVTREDLEVKRFRDLAEALSDVEGVDVRGGTGKTGGLDISIRGLPSEYTLILIDGRRQNVAGDVTPNGFGAAMTSFMPPISAIERIEVIRGPMSTLYGSDAIGGVVNIITRKVATEWGGGVRLEQGLPQDKDWGTQQKVDIYANGPLIEGLLGLAVRGGTYHREASEWVLAPGAAQPTAARNPAPAESRQYSIGARLTLTPGTDHDFWLDVDQGNTWYNNDDGRLGGRDSLIIAAGSGTLPGYKDALRFNREQIAIGHTSRFSAGVLESSLSQNTTETLGRTIPGTVANIGQPFAGFPSIIIGNDRALETTNTVLDTKFVTPLGNANTATLGAQWWKADLKDGLLAEEHEQTLYALFVEDEWRVVDNVAITLGGRYDDHDVFGGHFSPRTYAVWNTTDTLTVKGGVGQGFKAPRLNQLIDGISGIGGQGTTISIGNPNLKPETSTNTELSVLYNNAGISGSVTLFHNEIEDKIGSGGSCATNPISSCIYNNTASYSINIDEAKTWGAELSGRLPLASGWALQLGYTWTDSEIIQAGQKTGKLSNTPEHKGMATLRWSATDKLNLWLRGEYRGESRRYNNDYAKLSNTEKAVYNTVGDLKAYSLFDLGGTYRVSEKVTFNANVTNLLDKDFSKYASLQQVDQNGVPQVDGNGDPVMVWHNQYFQGGASVTGGTLPGRTFWFSVNVDF